MSNRLATSTPELDDAEQAWWREFGEVEERYCWVQPAEVQRVLRHHYVREIAALVRPGDRVLELGCGTGWLSRLLADEGVVLTGIDFSAAQIERARAGVAGMAHPPEFRVAALSELLDAGERYDVVITHAFLHHLATDEVRGVLAQVVTVLADGGRLVAVEPVVHPGGRRARTLAEKVLFRMEHLPLVASNRRLRRMGTTEAAERARIEGRGRGDWPLGPSPKETAFVDDELAQLLAEYVPVSRREPVASMTFRVAEQLLLAELSQPRTWRAARRPVLGLARRLDRRLVHAVDPLSEVWIFELYVAGEAA